MGHLSRREFLTASTLAAGALAPAIRPAGDDDPDRAPEAPQRVGADDTIVLVLGFIGVGGWESGLLDIFQKFPDVSVAVRDVYEPHRPRAKSAAGDQPSAYSVGHHREGLDAIESRPQCACHFEYGHRLTNVGHLGNIALWTGEELRWDAEADRVTNHPEADTHQARAHDRAPWALPKV